MLPFLSSVFFIFTEFQFFVFQIHISAYYCVVYFNLIILFQSVFYICFVRVAEGGI